MKLLLFGIFLPSDVTLSSSPPDWREFVFHAFLYLKPLVYFLDCSLLDVLVVYVCVHLDLVRVFARASMRRAD